MAISKTQQFFENLWYRPTVWWLWFFLPLHWLLKILVWLRRAFYRWGLFKSDRPSVPVVVIGNITVGGTGKTPLAIFLLDWLKQQGYKPGLVTRGYGSDTQLHPQRVTASSAIDEVGDEPLLIFNRTQAPVVVDYLRSRGAKILESEYQCDLILCDDGLQHYALQRDIEILVVDKTRNFGNGWLMPFGPLRETLARGKHCNVQVVNGDQMSLQLGIITRLIDGQTAAADELDAPVTAVAAIGNPQRFFDSLQSLDLDFVAVPFPDHHNFSKEDFTGLEGNIMMTEKDAVKCKAFAQEHFYYLPISASLDALTLQKIATELQSLRDKNEP